MLKWTFGLSKGQRQLAQGIEVGKTIVKISAWRYGYIDKVENYASTLQRVMSVKCPPIDALLPLTDCDEWLGGR